jgi:hypothetical protein
MQGEIKSRLNFSNCFYNSIQKRLFFHLFKNKINVYRTMILHVVLYGCEGCSLALREEHKLKEFKNGVLMRMVGPMRDSVMGD